VYAPIVLGHAHHVDVHTVALAPGAVHPGVHDLIPETDGMQCAYRIVWILRTVVNHFFVVVICVVNIVFGCVAYAAVKNIVNFCSF
jgi:hypothetical protein